MWIIISENCLSWNIRFTIKYIFVKVERIDIMLLDYGSIITKYDKSKYIHFCDFDEDMAWFADRQDSEPGADFQYANRAIKASCERTLFGSAAAYYASLYYEGSADRCIWINGWLGN